MKIRQIKLEDDEYPKILKNINNPPKQLNILGNVDLLNEPGIAIIGSRNCTDVGRKIARNFAQKLSSVGLCINSGMALGIDTGAHLGAIDESGKTVAVLGCGLNKIYPKQNKELFYKIIDNGGAVISEYENNTEAASKLFVQRNRIVSGMSIGVLVVEAAHRSGTSITARFAMEEKKPIFCIPHDISAKLGVGTNRLLQSGAKCVVTVEDIMQEYEFLRDLKVENKQNNYEKKINLEEISKEYRTVYQCLGSEPVHINSICQKMNLDITEVSSTLTILELEGYIKRLPGSTFIIL